jgi:hypothetical protein
VINLGIRRLSQFWHFICILLSLFCDAFQHYVASVNDMKIVLAKLFCTACSRFAQAIGIFGIFSVFSVSVCLAAVSLESSRNHIYSHLVYLILLVLSTLCIIPNSRSIFSSH